MKYLLSLTLLALPLFSFGGPPVVTDDPFTPGKGNFDINIMYASYGGINATEAPIIDINYGPTDTTEIKLEIVHVETSEHTLEVENFIETGIKWRFYDDGKLFISTFPQYAYIGIDKDHEHEDIEVITLPLQMSYKISESFGLTFESAYQIYITNHTPASVIELGAVFTYVPKEGIDIMLDINDKNDFKQIHRTSYLLGLKYPFYKNNISLLLSGGYASYKEHDNGTQGYAGLNFHF